MDAPMAGARPSIIDKAADQMFAERARSMGLEPESVWVGGYVDYEWSHLRPILDAYGLRVKDQAVLEFGTNVGASAIVLGLLGATVEAVDVSDELVALARCNAARYGVSPSVFRHVADTRRLPFPSAHFDLVSCNSVLEYVEPSQLAAVQREIDRVLRPGGRILVTGTSSRLWPREVHSGAWLVNYLPRVLDPVLYGKRRPERGVWPWVLRDGFGPGYRNLDAEDGGRAFLAARRAMQPRRDGLPQRAVVLLARTLGIGPGMLANSVSCLLRKPLG